MKNGSILILVIIIFILTLVQARKPPPPRKGPNANKRLIELSDKEPAKWMTNKEIEQLMKNRKFFRDITDNSGKKSKSGLYKKKSLRPFVQPGKPKYKPIVENLLRPSDLNRMKKFLTEFSAFFTRHFTSESEPNATKWLRSQVNKAMAKFKGSHSITDDVFYYYGNKRQTNIIVRINGYDPKLKSQVIVLGAHHDSIGDYPYRFNPGPGADDNGSGCSILLEILWLLNNAGFRPRRSIEVHFYAMEEEGAAGSNSLVQDYVRKKVNVVGMLCIDAVGSKREGSEDIASLYLDYTSPDLNQYIRILAAEYLTYKLVNQSNKLYFSDHIPWNGEGYHASWVSSLQPSPYIHSGNDTVDKLDFNQINEFLKLGMAFVVEFAQPMNK